MFRKLLLIIVVLLAVGGFVGWRAYKSGRLQEMVIRQVEQQVLNLPEGAPAITKVLGFTRPQTYLVLFLNNTELRPGGGFIGAYSTVRVDKGRPEILKVEGTEILDNSAPKDFPSLPPAPLKNYLRVDRWNFRDSNWYPDFASSSAKSLELYRLERGVAADEVVGVIGITPTVIEEVLKITGPIKVGNETYNSDNVIRKLEHEVEYGYTAKGLDFDERKKALADMTHALMNKLQYDLFLHWSRYLELAERMAREKHIVAYSTLPEAQNVLAIKDWAGLMRANSEDYLLWADANLASLKTDLVMGRELTYSLTPTTTASSTPRETYLATVKMKYEHKGKFDQFTTRYRTYARLYVPPGSKFVKVKGALRNDRTTDPGAVDQGIENGRQWFGAFIAIEPGKTGVLEWQYYAAPTVAEQIKNGNYKLLAQKQIGTIAHQLNLSLDFGKRVNFASPGEPTEKHGDNRYELTTDLRVDREFEVKMTN